MGVGRFTPLRFTANIKSILHACFWSCFFYVMPSKEFMSIFSIRFPKALLQMMVCFLRRNPL